MFCFLFLLGVPCASWICSLVSDIDLDNPQSLLIQIFPLFLSLFLLLLISSLCVCSSFYSFPTILGYSVHFDNSIDRSSGLEILSSSVVSLVINPSKVFFISVTILFISSISFWFFLSIYTSLFMLSSCSCMLSALSITAF